MGDQHIHLVDAGHREQLHLDKKMSRARGVLATGAEVRGHKGPLALDALRYVTSIWFCGPRGDLTQEEGAALMAYMKDYGGAVIICGQSLPLSFNQLLRAQGITFGDKVISPVYITSITPDLVSIQGGMINRALADFVGDQDAVYLYPSGAALEVREPSVAWLTTGMTAYPSGRPVASYTPIGKGCLVVIGSSGIFGDDFFKSDSNEKLMSFVVALAATRSVKLNEIEAHNTDLGDRSWVPDIGGLAEQLRSCIQESEHLHADIRENFDKALFHMGMEFMAGTTDLATTIGLKPDPLQQIRPQFDQALPRLIPAVFPPQMREPVGPRLELFDLDEAFASSKTRLAQLAQRTPAKNLEKFIIQAAKILGILPQLPEGKKDGKHVLQYVFLQISKYKQPA